jgi:hypothetical protein
MDSQANQARERRRLGPVDRSRRHPIRSTILGAIAAALATIALVVASSGKPAAAAASSLNNGNFETGDLSGWSVDIDTIYGGDASAVTSFEYCPPTWWGCGPEGGLGNTYITPPEEGSYFALLTAGYYQSDATKISQPFEASNGDKVSGWAFFQTENFSLSGCTGSEALDDTGKVVIKRDSGTTVATPFEQNTNTVPSPQNGGNSGWIYWEYTFTGLTGTGQFQIEARVQNNTGTGGVSRMGLDDVKTSTGGTDATPPETYITSGPCGVSPSTSATFEFHSNEQGSTFKCQLSKEGTIVQAWEDCTSPKSYSNLSRHQLWETSYRFEVKAIDHAGNVDPTPASRGWFIDTDTTAPTLMSTFPTAGTTGVARTTNITATFSERMDPFSVTTSTFKLFKCSSTTSTNCATQITNVAVGLSTDRLMATLNPYGTSSTLLASRTKYKVVVTTGVRDEAGNALSQQKVWYFTTGRT